MHSCLTSFLHLTKEVAACKIKNMQIGGGGSRQERGRRIDIMEGRGSERGV